MLRHGGVRNHEVIHVAESRRDRTEGLVDCPLECLSSIPEAEGHAAKFP